MSRRLHGGITTPKGFLAAGIHSGIKKTKQRDLALVTSEIPGPIAGVFTKNTVPAAPVILDRHHLKKGVGQAIIINSGNANAFTGTDGLKHAREMAHLVAGQLGIPKHRVFVGSTGVIGAPLSIASFEKRDSGAGFQAKKSWASRRRSSHYDHGHATQNHCSPTTYRWKTGDHRRYGEGIWDDSS